MEGLFASSVDTRVGDTGETTTRTVALWTNERGLDWCSVRVGKEYWQEPEWQLANEGYVSLFR